MADKNTPQTADVEETEAGEEKLTRADVTALVNNAITNHLQRFSSKLDKSIGESVAKALQSAQPKAEDKPADGAAAGQPAKVDPETRLLREKLEAFEKRAAEADARAKATEEKARKDATRAQLREQLDAMGIKGARARAVLADFETSGVLRYDPETGAPQVVVKRTRAKGAKPEELAFEDLAEGLKDWAKTPEAAEFLPAPGATPGANRAAAGTAQKAAPVVRAGGGEKAADTYEGAVSGLAESMERGSIDLSSLFE
jgi:hypothetical protein